MSENKVDAIPDSSPTGSRTPSSIGNHSIYKAGDANSTTNSKFQLNVVTNSESPYKSVDKSPPDASIESNLLSKLDTKNSIGPTKKKRDSVLLSTSFVSARNRNGYTTPTDRGNKSNLHLLRGNKGPINQQTSDVSLPESVFSSNETFKTKRQSGAISSSDSLSSIKMRTPNLSENKQLKKPPSANLLDKNQFSPTAPDTGNKNFSNPTSKGILFKSRRETINENLNPLSLESNISAPANKQYFLSSLQKHGKEPVFDVKAERDLLAAEKALIVKINKVSRNLNKHYEQQNHYKNLLDDMEKHIMMGSYTSDHISQYSAKLKANNNMHQNAAAIKTLESELLSLQKKLDDLWIVKYNLTQRQDSNDSLNTPLSLHHNKSGIDHPYGGTSTTHNDALPYSEETFSTPLQQMPPKFYNSSEMSPYGDVNSNLSKILSNRRVISTGSQLDILANDTVSEDDTWEVSNCLQSLQEKTNDYTFILEKSNRLIELLKKSPKLKDDLISSAYLPAIQQMVLNENSKIVASGYRVCRHLLIVSSADPHAIQKIWERSKFEIALIKTLTSVSLTESIEREQAIKLIRAIMEVSRTVSLSLIQAVISALENAEVLLSSNDASLDNLDKADPIRDTSIELLLEMCYLAPMNIVQSRCNRLLESLIIGHNNYKVSKIIMDTMLNLMTFHETRKHYLNYFSLQFLFEILTGTIDFSERQIFSTKLLEKCIVLLSLCLKSFTGLMIFAKDDFKQLKELVRFLKIPSLVKYLIDLFLDVLNIKKVDYHDDAESKNKSFKMRSTNLNNELNVVMQYQSIIAKVLVECELSNYLKVALRDKNNKSTNSLKCKYLLAEFSKICGKLLFSDGINPELSLYLAKDNVFVNHPASNELFKQGTDNSFFISLVIDYSQYVSMTYNLSQQNKGRYIETAKNDSYRRLEMNMINKLDETAFKHLIDQTGVLQSKNYIQWDWGLILVICKDLLNINKRLDDLNRNTKFIRRLLVFYRPFRYRFSLLKIDNVKNSDLIIDVGCEFFTLLTRTRVGMKILNEDLKFFPQIINCFYKLFEGIEEQNVLSKSSLKTTLSSGYIKILATLTITKEGVSLLNKWNIFSIIYKLFHYKGNEFQCILSIFIRELKLWNSPHPLLILKKALVHHNATIRKLSTEMLGYHLGLIFKPELPYKDIDLFCKSFSNYDKKLHLAAIDSLTQKQESEILELLVQQLYDISSGVVAAADKMLYTYASNEYYDPSSMAKHNFSRNISLVVPLVEPVVEQLIMINSPLLYLILTDSSGFKILNNIGHLDNERNKWLSFKNFEYVSLMEHMILDGLEFKDDANNNKEMPLHFYKTLAATEPGLRYITSKSDFILFSNNIREFSMYVEDDDVYTTVRINELKSAIWCVAFIGSSDLGINMLESSHLIHDLVKISKFAKNVSVKFTSFLALGLVASTKNGCEIVNELGWDCSVTPTGEPTGICLPLDINFFLTFPEALKKNDFWENTTQKGSNDIFLNEVFSNQATGANIPKYKNDDPNIEKQDHQTMNVANTFGLQNNKSFTGLGMFSDGSNIHAEETGYSAISAEEKAPDEEDNKSSLISLVSREPSITSKQEKPPTNEGNSMYPDTSSGDMHSLVSTFDSFSKTDDNNEDVSHDNNKLIIPVEKFKTEIVEDNTSMSQSQHAIAIKTKEPEEAFPDMTMGIDLDNLLFMTKIIEDPTLLNDEDYETELKLKKHENMIQTLNEFGNKKFNWNLGKDFNNYNRDNTLEDGDFSSLSEEYKQSDGQDNYMFQRIIQLVSQLNNHFLLNDSRRELMKYYKDSRITFYYSHPDIVNKVVDFMAIYKFSFLVRKFLCDLFLSNKSIEILMKKESTKMKYYDM